MPFAMKGKTFPRFDLIVLWNDVEMWLIWRIFYGVYADCRVSARQFDRARKRVAVCWFVTGHVTPRVFCRQKPENCPRGGILIVRFYEINDNTLEGLRTSFTGFCKKKFRWKMNILRFCKIICHVIARDHKRVWDAMLVSVCVEAMTE